MIGRPSAPVLRGRRRPHSAAAWVLAAVFSFSAASPAPVWAGPSDAAPSSRALSAADRGKVTELYTKGNRLLNAKRYAEAERAFIDALELAPDIPAIHHGLGLVYVQTQEYELAVLHFEEALKRDPEQVKSIYSLAKAYSFVGENAKAEEGYLRAIRLRPNFEAALQELAGIYHRQKRWDLALEYLARAREANPRSARTLTLTGVTGVYAGRTDVALEAVTALRQMGQTDRARRLEYLIYTEKQKSEEAGRAAAAAKAS